MNKDNRLFSSFDLDQMLAQINQRIINKINNENNEYLANININDYLDYIQSEFEIVCPILDEENCTYEKEQRPVEKYNQFYSEIGYVDGVVIKVFIPFEGDGNLFHGRASSWSSMLPRAIIEDKNIIITIGLAIHEIEGFSIENAIKKEVDNIKKHLEFTKKDLESFNNNIKSVARAQIEYKITNYKKISKLVESIPYQLKRNDAVPTTFKVPNVVRKVEIKKPSATQKLLSPDPTLDFEEYNHILEICSDVALVMERSPKAFITMDEEAIRTNFLFQLNGHYQGQATGETFNSNGKTDILIRNENQNVFIAECKFWKGEKAFLETIDQLLGYITYRDTKTAILIFVRNKDFSNVLNEIQKATPKHDNYVNQDKSYNPPIESAYRYVFKNKNDENKNFFLTVIAFHVPTINESSC